MENVKSGHPYADALYGVSFATRNAQPSGAVTEQLQYAVNVVSAAFAATHLPPAAQ